MTRSTKAIRNPAPAALCALVCAVGSGVAAIGAVAADAPSSRVDPCKLITVAEVQAALGVAIGQPTDRDDSLFRNCIFKSADGRHSLYFQARDLTQADFERGMKMKGAHGIAVDPSFGPDAHADESSGTLLVWKKGVSLNIKVGDQSGNQSKAKLEQAQEKIAKSALARL
jgi:hypothetical protein